MVVTARHPTRDHPGKDYHMVQMLAVKDRVSGYHLSNEQPTSSAENVDSADFLPTLQENTMLKMILSACKVLRRSTLALI